MKKHLKNLIVFAAFILSLAVSCIFTIRVKEKDAFRYPGTTDVDYLLECVDRSAGVIFEKLFDNKGSIRILGGQLPVLSVISFSGDYNVINDANEKEWLYKITLNDSSLLSNGETITIYIDDHGILVDDKYFVDDAIDKRLEMLDYTFDYYSSYLEVIR